MAIFAGIEKLGNRTMAQNSHFIIGKNKFGYREKQQRLMVLLSNLWNKVQRKQFKLERNAFLLKVQLILLTTIETILEKIKMKLLFLNNIKIVVTLWQVTTATLKLQSSDSYDSSGQENMTVFFASLSTCKGQLIQTAIEEMTPLFLRKR